MDGSRPARSQQFDGSPRDCRTTISNQRRPDLPKWLPVRCFASPAHFLKIGSQIHLLMKQGSMSTVSYYPTEYSTGSSADVSQAYFAEAPEVAFGVVRRDLFQPTFEAHLAGSQRDGNPAVYAIRNCILATGCRIKNAPIVGWAKAVEMAAGWFENALSVHTELVYMPTTIIAVTALTIMVMTSKLQDTYFC